MSFFEDASLVLIPSGIKNQKIYSVKPTDGTGDLTFTRASNATRVASNGLIEKVRTNELTYSNDFSNAAWTKTNATITSGQSGYDGTTNASLLATTAQFAGIQQLKAQSGLNTFSVYAKAGTFNFIFIEINGGGGAWFDLSNGTAGIAITYSSKIESVGGGWYRCSVSGSGTTSAVTIYPQEVNGTFTTNSGNIVIQATQLETGDIATDYIATTTTTAVSVGPVSGLPRLDYLNSSCPRLLLEPSSTTLLPFSEQLDNAAWDKTSGGASITANSVTSPDGYTNADTITGTGTSVAFVLVRQTITVAAAGTYTFSGFFKYNNHPFVSLNLSAYDGGGSAYYNIQTGAVTSVSAGSTAKIENYGNGWYRCSLTSAIGASDLTGRPSVYVAYDGTTSDFPTAPGAAGKAVYAWGFNMCLGSYVQSYLPTLSTSVTRVADAASKTGISSLIGQTEGTLFVEVERDALQSYTQRIFTVSDDTNNNVIGLQLTAANGVTFYVENGGVNQVGITKSSATTANQKVKIAAAYKANDFVLYIDGVQAAADTSGSVPATSVLRFANPSGTFPFIGEVSQALLFKTRLTNAQLAELTTL
jgi:hypothetical protein